MKSASGSNLYLEQSSWIIELEHALERFSIRTYLDWLDQHYLIYDSEVMDGVFPERFLNYLKDKVSNPCSKIKCVLQVLIQGKLDLRTCYVFHRQSPH